MTRIAGDVRAALGSAHRLLSILKFSGKPCHRKHPTLCILHYFSRSTFCRTSFRVSRAFIEEAQTDGSLLSTSDSPSLATRSSSHTIASSGTNLSTGPITSHSPKTQNDIIERDDRHHLRRFHVIFSGTPLWVLHNSSHVCGFLTRLSCRSRVLLVGKVSYTSFRRDKVNLINIPIRCRSDVGSRH
jgi:hypothetical protein